MHTVLCDRSRCSVACWRPAWPGTTSTRLGRLLRRSDAMSATLSGQSSRVDVPQRSQQSVRQSGLSRCVEQLRDHRLDEPAWQLLGKTSRHRLNRGGDRQANYALWTVAMVRMRGDARTREYVARRTSEGLSKKEIHRCLKRYIVRELYPLILADLKDAGQSA